MSLPSGTRDVLKTGTLGLMSSHKSETAADNGLEFADATKQKKKQIQCKYYEMKLKEGSLSPFYHMNI